jgi:hypothetical protein
MAEFWTARDAFAHFGAVMKNPRWSWSARSPDGNVVVITWWKDEERRHDGKLVYDCRHHPRLDQWRDRHGNRDRTRNLAHARDHCDGLFRIVWAKARDPSERVRETVERYPDDAVWMRLVELNERTGEFLAAEAEHA